jgi:hypothetical protein
MAAAIGALGGVSGTPNVENPPPPPPATATPPSSSTPSATSETDEEAFSRLMSDVSANGTSGQTLLADAAAFERVGGKDAQTMTAVKNMASSLSDGTYSQQGTQGALQGAAQRDQMSGITNMPVISGMSGLHDQNAGFFDSAKETKWGSVGANANILQDEIEGNAPKSQIINNATALYTEATNAGDKAFATLAKNVIDQENSGTLNSNQTTVHDMFSQAFQS